MRVCKREHDLAGEEVRDGGKEGRAKAWLRTKGTWMRLGRGVSAPTQGPTTQDLEEFHLHAKSVRGLLEVSYPGGRI